MTRFITITAMNLVTPKAAAKHELLFNKLASRQWLVEQKVITKFTIVTDMWLTLCGAT